MANTKVTSAVIADNAITSAKIDSTSTGMTFADLTVDTSTLVVDATNNRVSVGNTSPTDKLHVGTSSGGTQLKIQSGSGVNNCVLHTNGTTDSWRVGMNLVLTNGSYEFYDDVNNVDRMVITSSGSIGINNTSPSSSYKLDIAGKQRIVNNADTAAITLERTAATTGAYNLGVDGDGAYRLSSASQVHQQIDDQGISYYRAYTDMTFGTGSSGTERMRVDSAGTLNIATTGGTWSGFTGKIENYLSSWANWGNSGTLFAHNARYDGTNYVALGTGKAQRLWLNSAGNLSFETANSATAGNALTFQNLMTLKKDSATYQEVMEINSADRTLSTGQGAGIVFKGKVNTDGTTTQLAQIVGFRDNTTNGYTSGGLSFYTRAVYTNPMVERIRIDEAGRTCFGGIKDLRDDEGYVFGNSSSAGADATNMIKIRDDKGIADGASYGAGTGPDTGFAILSVTKQVTGNVAKNFFRFRNREGAGVAHIYYGFSMGGKAVQRIDKLAMTYSESTLTNEITKARSNETLTCSVSTSGDTHTISFTSDQTQNVTATILVNSTGISSTTHSTNLDEL